MGYVSYKSWTLTGPRGVLSGRSIDQRLLLGSVSVRSGLSTSSVLYCTVQERNDNVSIL